MAFLSTLTGTEVREIRLSEFVVDKSLEYMDIFGPLEKQIKAVDYLPQSDYVYKKVMMKELEVI